MSKTVRTTLFVAATCVGFVIGVAVGTVKKAEHASRQPAPGRQMAEPQSTRVRAQTLRKALAKKDKTIRELEADLAQLPATLSPFLGPEELERYMEWKKERQRAERSHALFEKARAMRKKMKDDALRQEGLAELAALIQSENPDDQLLGLTSLLHLDGLKLDTGRFKPQVLAGLSDELADVRHAALNCIRMVCSDEEVADIALRMAHDPSAEVGASAVLHLGFLSGERGEEDLGTPQGAEEVEGVLTSLLRDEDEAVRERALFVLGNIIEHSDDDAQIEAKRQAFVTDLSSDPRIASDALSWWETRAKVSAEDAQRFLEMLLEHDVLDFGGETYDEHTLRLLLPSICTYPEDDGPPPFLCRLSLRLLRDSPDDDLRRRSLDILREVEDPSLLPELEEIAWSGAPGGIAEQLAGTIEYLQQKRKESEEEKYEEEPTGAE